MTDFRYENGTWVVDDITSFQPGHMNDILQYGQPYNPYMPGFDRDIPFNPDVSLAFSQLDVMVNGYGASIAASDFSAVQQWVGGGGNLGSGIYSFSDLVNAGVAAPTDRTISAHLYPFPGAISSGEIPPVDAAYIHGSVGFALMSNTTFFRVGGNSGVIAEIGALTDNFDYESSRIPAAVNAMVFTLFGPDEVNVNLPVEMYFVGQGKISSLGMGSVVAGAISSVGSLVSDGLNFAMMLATGWASHNPGGSGGGGSAGGGSGGGNGNDPDGPGTTGGTGITTGGELSAQTGGTTGTFTPPGTWSDGGSYGTPDPGLPINPDYTGIQPIILDLDGDGVEIAVNAQISFDWDGDGFRESGNWAAADDGFLVVDLEAANLPIAPGRCAA